MERKNHLKLFVWENFSPDYTSGLAFAIAKDEEEGKKLIREKRGMEVRDWGDLHIYPLHKKNAFCVSGGS